MKFTYQDKEYPVKTRHAIEILDLVEKSGVLEKFKALKELKDISDIAELVKIVPFSYKLANQVIALATGELKEGKVIPNNDLADQVDAMESPILAFSVVRGLIAPISYVITDDTLAEEKKITEVGPVSIEEKSGKLEEKPGVTGLSETSIPHSVTPDSKPE